MSEEHFADLFQEKSVKRQKLSPGDRIEATIADIQGENTFLDIGGKSEGVIKTSELKEQNEEEITLKAGDLIKVFFVGHKNGEMIFTTSLGSGQASLEELENAFHAAIPLQGTVVKEVKGGFEVKVAGQRAFCPYSQIGIRRADDPEVYIGETLKFKVKEFSNNGRNIIVSAREIQEAEREEQQEELKQTLEEEMEVEGVVTSIRDFGAFVDIGGIDGLIPISELTWGQVEKVGDVLSLDQKVKVIIKKLDWNNKKISLSLKDTTENPWDKVEENFTVGSIHTGIIVRLTQFGAFVSLCDGVDGLLHISKLGGGRRINHPREVVEQGQEITVKIDGIDSEKKRISLVPEDYSEARREGKERDRNQTEEQETKKYMASSKSSSMGTMADLFKKINK